jgi:uncharacterized protein with HEPN domain
MKRPDATRLIDIIEAANHIAAFFRGSRTFEDFVNDELFHSAVSYQLIIIGEASTHISEELKIKYSDGDWDKIKAFRNYVVHEYFGTEIHKVWKAASENVPALRNYCEKSSEPNFLIF